MHQQTMLENTMPLTEAAAMVEPPDDSPAAALDEPIGFPTQPLGETTKMAQVGWLGHTWPSVYSPAPGLAPPFPAFPPE